jgi:hypothetical protein
MSITFNIYGSGASSTTAEPEEVAPMAGGASVEIASLQATDAMRTHGHASDAGPPSAALVQEVEAALLLARAATRDGAVAQQSGINAGAAQA